MYFLIIFLLLTSQCFASAPSRPNNYVSGTTIDPVAVTANENTLYTYLQNGVDTFATGSISNGAISGTAGITYGKLNLSGSILGSDIASNANLSIGTESIGAGLTVTGSITDNGTFKLGSTNQGDILYDNGTSIVRLTPGTSGQVLQTQGASANPQWSYPSGQLGSWVSKSDSTVYQATTDGQYSSWAHCPTNPSHCIATCITDSSNPPTTTRTKQNYSSSGALTGSLDSSCTTMVKKNDYYESTFSSDGGGSATNYFIAIGS